MTKLHKCLKIFYYNNVFKSINHVFPLCLTYNPIPGKTIEDHVIGLPNKSD